MIIAVDGPAGSGKSTVSKEVARKKGLLYIDTGAMYRALTLKAMSSKLDLSNENAIIGLAQNTRIDLTYKQDDGLSVFLDGEDVTDKIRTPELTNNVKFISGVAGVREEMVKMQRAAARIGAGAVLEGRDIGTIVFPDADKKFYLDADINERTKRRYKELVKAGQAVSLSDVEEDVRIRDKNDIEREYGPLKKADDAIVVDTTGLTIDQVVEKMLSYIG